MSRREEQLDLFAAVCNGELSARQQAALESALLDNPAAQAQYLNYITLHSHLRASFVSVPIPALAGIREPRTRTPKLPVLSPVEGRRSRSVWYAAALIALVLTAWILFLPEPRTLNSRRPPAPVATLLQTDNATFADSPAPMNLGGSLPAGPIKLTSGSAQVMFASTAVVDLAGPCEFEMTGPNRGRLTAGTLEAFVPENASGFTVDLPGEIEVIDLGTRFFVTIDASGRGDIVVHDGAVQVRGPLGSHRMLAGQQAAIEGRVVRVFEQPADRPNELLTRLSQPPLDADFAATNVWTLRGHVNVSHDTDRIPTAEPFLGFNIGQHAPNGVAERRFVTRPGQAYELRIGLGKYLGGEQRPAQVRVQVIDDLAPASQAADEHILMDQTAAVHKGSRAMPVTLKYFTWRFTADTQRARVRLADASADQAINFDTYVGHFQIRPITPTKTPEHPLTSTQGESP